MKNYILIAIFLTSIFAAGCAVEKISSFDECVAAGNPVMESYPRQCRAGDNLFIEEIAENKAHYCTAEEKAAKICTMDYNPVCGDDMETYGNACGACGKGAAAQSSTHPSCDDRVVRGSGRGGCLRAHRHARGRADQPRARGTVLERISAGRSGGSTVAGVARRLHCSRATRGLLSPGGTRDHFR